MNALVEMINLNISPSKRNIILYGLGKLVSLFGTQIYSFALSLYVLRMTGSGMTFATTLAIGMLPRVLLGPISGIVADRIDRKKIIITMDILCGISMLAFFGIASVYGIKILYIYFFSFLLTTLNTFFDVALDASKPNIVENKDLIKINSVGQGIMSMAAISGPFLGGVIYAMVDINIFLLINGISFIISAISESFIDFTLNNNENIELDYEKDNKGITNELLEGLKYFKNNKMLFTLMSFSFIINFLLQLSITVPIPYLLNNVVMVSSFQYGLVQGFWPVGMLLGAIILSWIPEKKSLYKQLLLLMITFVILIYLIGVPMLNTINLSNNGIFSYYLVTMGLLGLVIAFIDIPLISFLQRQIPNELRGRVFGIVGTISIAIAPLGVLIAGFLIEKIPMAFLPIGSGILLSVMLIFFINNKELKEI